MSARLEIAPGTSIGEDLAALQFEHNYAGQLAYCHDQGAWFQFDGSIWRQQRTRGAYHMMRELARMLAGRATNPSAMQKSAFVAGMERHSQNATSFARHADHWNPDHFLLGTPDGTVSLKSGVLRPSKASDNISCATAVPPIPMAVCPIWKAFLKTATGNDPQLIRFLQQIAGYSLTADTREHALFFIYGPGGNGKSVFLNVLTKILGDYARTADITTLESHRTGAIRSDLATLAPARLVTVSETEGGGGWSQSRVQQLTGGDPVTARFMRQNEFTFSPKFKLIVVGNHKPALKSVDDAIKRRMNIIPFTLRPEKPDKLLEAKLVAEWPGILRWMIEGCIDWQRHGLVRPQCVIDATDAYFEEQDVFGQWLNERCDVKRGDSRYMERASLLFASWTAFCKQNGDPPGNSTTFAETLSKGGFSKKRSNSGNIYLGIALRGEPE